MKICTTHAVRDLPRIMKLYNIVCKDCVMTKKKDFISKKDVYNYNKVGCCVHRIEWSYKNKSIWWLKVFYASYWWLYKDEVGSIS